MKRIVLPALFAIVLILLAFKEFNHTETQNTMENSTLEPAGKGIVVLELFTSQGCSSCPPADMLLQKIKNEYPDNVFALSYHVDYWNYIGWEDPFSNPAYTIKQRDYNLQLKSKSNYTPQLVINGKEHVVGSNKTKVFESMQKYFNAEVENMIELTGVRNGRKLSFDYKILGNLTDKEIRAVIVLNERTTQVKRGENRNRILKNSNIVVAEKFLPTSNHKSSSFIDIPSIVSETDDISLMLLIQNKKLEITGAAKTAVKG